MASVPQTHSLPESDLEYEEGVPPLENGDRLTQKEFHRRYEAMPDKVKAELIGGVVYMASPLKPRHGKPHGRLMLWIGLYQGETPGTDFHDNTTTIMGPKSEPQPDGALFMVHGGNVMEDENGDFVGSPELLAEVASTSASIDLHDKRADYERAGVQEYIVVAVRRKRVYWWKLRDGKFAELTPGADGIIRSETFPGLWLDPAALLKLDTHRLIEVARQGLASPEHAAFVATLAAKGRS